jgi:hypothetical protein
LTNETTARIAPPGPAVPASIKSDDDAFSEEFDAAPWLAQAGAEAILALARCGWAGNYPADEVAYWMRDRLAEIDDLLSHFEARTAAGGECGFWCGVDEPAALAWLEENRPGIYPMVRAASPD